jgi:hypothetical protein
MQYYRRFKDSAVVNRRIIFWHMPLKEGHFYT